MAGLIMSHVVFTYAVLVRAESIYYYYIDVVVPLTCFNSYNYYKYAAGCFKCNLASP